MSNLDEFREFLGKSNIEEEKIDQVIEMVIDLHSFINEPINQITVDKVFKFSEYLMEKEMNNYDNYIHLYRYGFFLRLTILSLVFSN